MLPAHYKSTLLIFNQITLDETIPLLYQNLEVSNYKGADANLKELRDSSMTLQLQSFADACSKFKDFLMFRRNEFNFENHLQDEFRTFVQAAIRLKEFIMETTQQPVSFEVINEISRNLTVGTMVQSLVQGDGAYPLPTGYSNSQNENPNKWSDFTEKQE